MSLMERTWTHDNFPTVQTNVETDLIVFPLIHPIVSGYYWKGECNWHIYGLGIAGQTLRLRVYVDGGDPDPILLLDSGTIDPQYDADQTGLTLIHLFWTPNQGVGHDRDTFMRMVAYLTCLWGDNAMTLPAVNNIQGQPIRNVLENGSDTEDWRGATQIRVTGVWSAASGCTADMDAFHLKEGVARLISPP